MRERKTASPSRMTGRSAVRRILALCLLVCFLLVVGTSFASYSSTGGADDGARVAKGAISVNIATGADVDYSVGNDGTVLMTMERPPDDSTSVLKTLPFEISSSSEVAIEYDIIVNVTRDGSPSDLPNGVDMFLMNKTSTGTPVNEDEQAQGKYVYIDAGAFDAASVETPERHTYGLMFTGNYDSITMNHGPFDIEIVVDAKQID